MLTVLSFYLFITEDGDCINLIFYKSCSYEKNIGFASFLLFCGTLLFWQVYKRYFIHIAIKFLFKQRNTNRVAEGL